MRTSARHLTVLLCAWLCSAAYSGVGTWSGDGADGNQALRLAPLTRQEVVAAYAIMQGAVLSALVKILRGSAEAP